MLHSKSLNDFKALVQLSSIALGMGDEDSAKGAFVDALSIAAELKYFNLDIYNSSMDCLAALSEQFEVKV